MNFNLSNFFNEAAFSGLAICSSLLLAGHWFPWSRFIGTKLPRLWAYAYGTACIWLGFFIWRFIGYGDLETPFMLAVLDAVSGMCVSLAYRIDEVSVKLDTDRRKGRID